jgi:hypothetical protein
LLSVGGSNFRQYTYIDYPLIPAQKFLARPDGFEPPTTWFEARRNRKIENFEFSKTLIFNDHARGMSVANSPESTTKHHSVTQMSRNHLVCLDQASGI